jgi:hypothetical protein
MEETFLRIEALAVVLLRIKVFWDVRLCCWGNGYGGFEVLHCLHLMITLLLVLQADLPERFILHTEFWQH